MAADELKIAERDTETLIQDIKRDLCLISYRPNATDPRFTQLNSKIEAIFEAEFGYPIFSRDVTPYHIMGSPGHGKTTCFKVAAQWFSEQTQMNLVVNPTDDYMLQDNDILMVILDLSGETSNIKFTGLPTIREYESAITTSNEFAGSKKYTTSAPPKSLQSLSEATVSILLLDDFSNASPSIQNIGLSVMLEKQYQALKIGKHAFVNSTGNLGAIDGTNVSPTSTAMASRRQTYLAKDTPHNWAKRTQKQFPDMIGDAGLGGFFEQYDECFSMPSKSKKGEAFACPRAWSHFVHYARESMHIFEHQLKRSNGLDGYAFDLDNFLFKAEGHVGSEVVPKLRAYYISLTNDVTPIAKRMLDGTPLTEEQTKLLSSHSTKGGNESEFFFSMLTRALGERTAIIITQMAKEDPDNYIQNSTEALKRMAHNMLDCGVVPMKLHKISEGTSSFAHKLALLNESSNTDLAFFSKNNNQPIINQDLLTNLIKVVASHPKAHTAISGVKIAKMCFIDVLSNMDRIKSTQSKVDELDNFLSTIPSVQETLASKAQQEPEPEDELSYRSMGPSGF
ncbi:hypothetical protein OCF84_20985 (plasmid) [Shewanella xiamenensis]|uniref:Uncharacterized protein n=1 Tax=Shewanella xiamenensis TaxID=332186 RepID=A0ABT6UFJ8_9GAMM|nr:hypothetical protein [Shewanella xiamenensis]MDI5833254.1 hypothetical protein [Shewanella xiamenensis]WHF57995.1 hypothetical protein OCF84_20985 [Shewanella xiamenensis]